MKLRPIVVLSAATALLVGASACGSSDTRSDGGGGDDTELTIAVEYSTLAVPFITAVQRGIQAEAEKLGGITLIERDAEGQTEKQAGDINEMLTQDIDGMIVSGNGEAATLGALRPAIAQDLPIVGNVSQIGTQEQAIPQDTSVLAFVAQNEEQAGVEAAGLVQQALPEGGTYAIVLGATGYSENTTRVEQFTATLEASGQTYTKVGEQPGDWVPEGGQAACQNMLAANPDIQLFYALSDDMGVGCLNAIQQAGSEAQVVGVGGSQSGLDSVASGDMFGTIWYAPEEIGRVSLRTIVEYLRDGVEPETEYLETPIQTVTRENVDSVEAQW